jgi:hypothetical protein
MDFIRTDGDKLVINASDYGFAAGSGVATSAAGTGQFVYNATTKSLFWDADGSGSGAAVLIATFATIVG